MTVSWPSSTSGTWGKWAGRTFCRSRCCLPRRSPRTKANPPSAGRPARLTFFLSGGSRNDLQRNEGVDVDAWMAGRPDDDDLHLVRAARGPRVLVEDLPVLRARRVSADRLLEHAVDVDLE